MAGKPDSALSKYKLALEISPKNALILSNIASAYFQLNNLDNALKYALESIEYDNNRWSSHLDLASIYFLKNDLVNAKKAFGKAVELEPRLRNGMAALIQFEEEGHFYTEKEKTVLEKLFSTFK